jgi:hypothetical protein
VLFSDANGIFSRTWWVHLSQIGEAGWIIDMTEFLHLDCVVRAQEEIQIVLNQFTKVSANKVVDGLFTMEVAHMLYLSPHLGRQLGWLCVIHL